MSAKLGRRTFIRSLIGIFALLALLLWDVPRKLKRKFDSRSDDLLGPCLTELFGAAEVEKIGRAYLLLAPDENSRALLLARMGESAADSAGPACAEFSARAAAAVRRDYAAGNSMLVAGWRLSVTEARLCALSIVR